eukprot:TRINITY_DN8827_c0_g1_i1.p2 TRINITY_DN8827_c0_g1~~TRINITY_DN8827_c0_g1_i1.p2  ORF type:complete len:319 (-),score=146.43 TRINITY_DN8827_c0_g1_i1:1260-2216(-)
MTDQQPDDVPPPPPPLEPGELLEWLLALEFEALLGAVSGHPHRDALVTRFSLLAAAQVLVPGASSQPPAQQRSTSSEPELPPVRNPPAPDPTPPPSASKASVPRDADQDEKAKAEALRRLGEVLLVHIGSEQRHSKFVGELASTLDSVRNRICNPKRGFKEPSEYRFELLDGTPLTLTTSLGELKTREVRLVDCHAPSTAAATSPAAASSPPSSASPRPEGKSRAGTLFRRALSAGGSTTLTDAQRADKQRAKENYLREKELKRQEKERQKALKRESKEKEKSSKKDNKKKKPEDEPASISAPLAAARCGLVQHCCRC